MKNYKIIWRAGQEVWGNDQLLDTLLEKLTKDGQIADEFNLFISEPSSHAYHPLDEVSQKCEVFKQAAKKIRSYGMRVGIDQWPSFGAAGVQQAVYDVREMPFQSMVGVDGSVTERIACPISPEFLEYTREKFKIFAQAGPDFVWVDDDCRFTHLGGTLYPCFCPNCVAGFENGRFSSREELVDALNHPDNIELRHSWSRYGAKRLAAYCKAAREGVDAVDPSIDVPYMTVGYTHTTFSGDYIEQCMEVSRSRAGRPGHGYYWDEEPRKMFHKAMDVSRQVLRYPAESLGDVQYEEESFPCTPLNKAAGIRLLEAGLSIWGGCTGFAFNSLTFSAGDRPLDHMNYTVERWNKARPFFDTYLSFAHDLPQVGLWIADNEFMMAGMNAQNGWFDELNPDYSLEKVMNEWPEMGIVISADPANAYATMLQGKIVETFSDEQIREIFQKPVFMDAAALKVLEERGLAHYAGVHCGQTYNNSMEVLTDAAANGGFATASRNALFYPCTILEVDADDVEVLADCYDTYQHNLGPCVTRRGNVTVFSYAPYHFIGTVGKLCQMRNLLKDAGAPVMVEPADPYGINRVSAWARSDGKRAAILLINTALDPVLDTDLVIKGDMTKAVFSGIDIPQQAAEVIRREDGLKIKIPSMGAWDMLLILAD